MTRQTVLKPGMGQIQRPRGAGAFVEIGKGEQRAVPVV